MFSMPERLPGHLPRGVDLEAIEEAWPQLAATLADAEIDVRSMTTYRRRRASSAEVRLARRAARRQARQVLRGQQTGCRELPVRPQSRTASPLVDLADRREPTSAGLGVCESCRTEAATGRVTFADLVVFAVCAGCATGAVGVAA
jgi:hypothetical protein